MKKVIVSDYDQTFYINDENIENNKIAVRDFMNRGNIFIINTGRSFFDFKKKVNEYNIDYDYCIINHGATVLDKNDNIMFNFPMDNDIITNIKKDMLLEKSINNFCCSLLESRVGFNHKDLTKINARYNSKNEAMDINKDINEKYNKYVNSYYVTENSIEIISKITNKSKAIQLLMDRLNIDIKNVHTIGDGYSDIQMVKDFNGYCMEDSVNELKEVAKKEYSSVSDLVEEILGENNNE